MINRIIENGDDIWQLLAISLQSFHMRMGTLKAADAPAANIGPSMHDEQIVEVTKDLVLPTALVTLHALYMTQHQLLTLRGAYYDLYTLGFAEVASSAAAEPAAMVVAAG